MVEFQNPGNAIAETIFHRLQILQTTLLPTSILSLRRYTNQFLYHSPPSNKINHIIHENTAKDSSEHKRV